MGSKTPRSKPTADPDCPEKAPKSKAPITSEDTDIEEAETTENSLKILKDRGLSPRPPPHIWAAKQ